jgi:hypothetical protein
MSTPARPPLYCIDQLTGAELGGPCVDEIPEGPVAGTRSGQHEATRGRDRVRAERDTVSPRYKWVVLSNTTLGVLIATINSSILLIALPDIFRGIHINPLEPGNTSLLLWLIMGTWSSRPSWWSALGDSVTCMGG